MTHDHDPSVPLGVAVKARREALRLSRADVHAAGGPSIATLLRIETGETEPGTIRSGTRSGLEDALRLPPGWIDAYIAGEPLPETPAVAVASTSGSEQVLVGIVEGVARLTEAERRAVLTLVKALQNGRPHT